MNHSTESIRARAPGFANQKALIARPALVALFTCAAALALLVGPAAAQTGTGPHGVSKLVADCTSCHTTAGWDSLREPLGFEHDEQTRFPLNGRHADVTCAACHFELRFDQPRFASGDCAGCHLDVHQGTMPSDCASCHNTRSFQDAGSLEQHARGRFPLTGAHIQISCESCHQDDRGGAFSPLDTECFSCHRADYEGARAVDHAGTGLPLQCLQCHSTVSWRDAVFDHATSTSFALEGRHAGMECTGCHTGSGELKWVPAGSSDCVACHRADYDQEHVASGFPVECASCHTVEGWERDAFDHGAEAHGFALLGRHQQIPCTDCHVGTDNGLRFEAANQDDCVACHRTDYDREHGAAGYPTDCGRCHSVNGWSGADFDHGSAVGGFELVGRHQSLLCSDCHVPPDHALKWAKPAGQDDCTACHQPDYDREHTGSGYPTTCLICHDVNDWTHAVFDHVVNGNGFALAGVHAQAPCTSCHGPSNTLLFPQPASADDCVACHQPDYDAAHAGSGFPTTCAVCHTTTTFAGATFDHSSTVFPLVGAHVQALCESCHGPNNTLLFRRPASPEDCVACHQPEYDAAHAGSGFPTTCADCHTTDTFTGATFDHSNTGFTLVGAHVQALCGSCHGPNNTLLFPQPASPDDCVACHQAEYNLEHAGTGYPTTCLTCHSTTTFTGSTFNHDAQYFPIYSRKHNGKWSTCADCHTSAADYAVFSCLNCHQHSKTQMDNKHLNEPGYVYDSAKCLSCHPTGET